MCSEIPRMVEGAADTQSVSAALGAPTVPASPFTLAESLAAAAVVWPDTGMPEPLAVAGIVCDLMPQHRTPRRAVLARRLRIDTETLCALLLLWECTDDAMRFDATRRAVRIIRARRMGAACG
jgi:hypothetical protein